MGVLPVNWFGIVFMVLSFVLFVADIKAPTHGALTAAGMVSFIVGGLVLFNSTSMPGFPKVSVPLVVGTGVAFGLAFTTILTFALKAQRIPIRIGQESLLRQVGVARSELNPEGFGAAGERAVDGGAGGGRQGGQGQQGGGGAGGWDSAGGEEGGVPAAGYRKNGCIPWKEKRVHT